MDDISDSIRSARHTENTTKRKERDNSDGYEPTLLALHFSDPDLSLAKGPSAGLRWVYFVSPWGMTMELVSYPGGMAYEAGTKDILWRPADA
jgi:hypothetical protein